MPRDDVANLAIAAKGLIENPATAQLFNMLRNEVIRAMTDDPLKEYGLNDLTRDRLMLELKVINDLDKKLRSYARRVAND